MVASIIDSTEGGEAEVRRWYEEGRTYSWMVDEYLRKYELQVTMAMFSNRRAARGWKRRIVRDDELIPWDVKRAHAWRRPLVLLRYEARRRAGFPLQERYVSELDNFLSYLRDNNAVVHYDPDTEDGFFYVPREPQDQDIVRQPPKPLQTKRHSTD